MCTLIVIAQEISEPVGNYLWHFVPGKAAEFKKSAKIIPDNIVEWLKEKNIDDKLLASGGDSTNTNTGRHGGVMQWVERKLGRNLVWLRELLRSQDKEVMQIAMPVVKRSVWYAHSEAVIQTLICSDKEEEKKVGIEKILEIRGNADENVQMEDMSLKKFQ
ncbi:hypothetical protein HELRODRAFT_161044 [Helobdella robusta]|uniref:Uncharacterized protein n=1 Tax=Helobdella robusta TaxID=6412 RepID=T1ER19_HELRO|nr:hypothetical protein HELRODRAFT_161044 [Helobdella robusta]ESO01866.1 hypothetical protein HELRODRAFT_161044 [Helobdella robusta]